VKQDLHVAQYLRYMDDLLLFADDKGTLHTWAAEVVRFLAERLVLALKRQATVLAPTSEGVPLLGLRIWPAVVSLTARRRTRFLRGVKRARAAVETGPSPTAAMASLAGSCEAAAMADSFRLRAQATKEVWTEGRSTTRARTG
jgi:hypothetical protein